MVGRRNGRKTRKSGGGAPPQGQRSGGGRRKEPPTVPPSPPGASSAESEVAGQAPTGPPRDMETKLSDGLAVGADHGTPGPARRQSARLVESTSRHALD